jgi:hypothetical protein
MPIITVELLVQRVFESPITPNDPIRKVMMIVMIMFTSDELQYGNCKSKLRYQDDDNDANDNGRQEKHSLNNVFLTLTLTLT